MLGRRTKESRRGGKAFNSREERAFRLSLPSLPLFLLFDVAVTLLRCTPPTLPSPPLPHCLVLLSCKNAVSHLPPTPPTGAPAHLSFLLLPRLNARKYTFPSLSHFVALDPAVTHVKVRGQAARALGFGAKSCPGSHFNLFPDLHGMGAPGWVTVAEEDRSSSRRRSFFFA